MELVDWESSERDTATFRSHLLIELPHAPHLPKYEMFQRLIIRLSRILTSHFLLVQGDGDTMTLAWLLCVCSVLLPSKLSDSANALFGLAADRPSESHGGPAYNAGEIL